MANSEQQKFIALGRSMMEFSENYGIEYGLKGVTETGLATLNQLSSVGSLLTTIGEPYGARDESFTAEDKTLIELFLKQKTVDIDRK